MSVLKQATPWLCSYSHQGERYSITICHDDPDWLFAQMSQVLKDFEIDGWSAGYVTSANDLEKGLEEAKELPLPDAYQIWISNQRKQIN